MNAQRLAVQVSLLEWRWASVALFVNELQPLEIALRRYWDPTAFTAGMLKPTWRAGRQGQPHDGRDKVRVEATFKKGVRENPWGGW